MAARHCHSGSVQVDSTGAAAAQQQAPASAVRGRALACPAGSLAGGARGTAIIRIAGGSTSGAAACTATGAA